MVLDFLDNDAFYVYLQWAVYLLIAGNMVVFFSKRINKYVNQLAAHIEKLNSKLSVLIKDQSKLADKINVLEQDSGCWGVFYNKLSKVYDLSVSTIPNLLGVNNLKNFLYFKFGRTLSLGVYSMKLQRETLDGNSISIELMSNELSGRRKAIIERSKDEIGPYYAELNEAAQDQVFESMKIELYEIINDKSNNDKESRILEVLKRVLIDTIAISVRTYRDYLSFIRRYESAVANDRLSEAADLLKQTKCHNQSGMELKDRHIRTFTLNNDKEFIEKERKHILIALKKIKL